MQKVSGILQKLLKQYGLEGKMVEYTMSDKWEAIVGKNIAAHSCPAGIHHKRLYVIVDSPVWLQEMSFYKDDLAEKVNNYYGKKIIKEVCLKTGQII